MTVPIKTTGTKTGTGYSSAVNLEKHFNISLDGITGTTEVDIERSFSGAAGTYYIVKTYTADIQETGIEPEAGVFYRLNVRVYDSGTITYRLAQTPYT